MTHSETDIPSVVGVLHPGKMGVTIASALVGGGHSVYWASQGRSSDTASRAQLAHLNDITSLESLCLESQYVFSICPPDQAANIALKVATCGFKGVYIDCNAVSPGTAKQVADIVTQQGATCVDGGIIGPPVSSAGTTRLYLSGKSASSVATLLADSLVDARVIGSGIGEASALKMAYAGWTKGAMALLMTQFALARQQNVESALLAECLLSQPGLEDKLMHACRASAPKAWRFIGEMQEIADTLEHAELPRGWFDAAAESYQRLSEFKNQSDVDHRDVIDALLRPGYS
ncbi:DUF1932 domain-containing protein [bacterium]|nr:DUF1932 domain-containing protein [bacterium]